MGKGINGICCSIEMEPKTLKAEQLNHAREVAADVVQKLQPVEASAIFNQVEGLWPVIGATEVKLETQVYENNKKEEIIEGPCQCSILGTPPLADSPDVIREPLSAPF